MIVEDEGLIVKNSSFWLWRFYGSGSLLEDEVMVEKVSWRMKLWWRKLVVVEEGGGESLLWWRKWWLEKLVVVEGEENHTVREKREKEEIDFFMIFFCVKMIC